MPVGDKDIADTVDKFSIPGKMRIKVSAELAHDIESGNTDYNIIPNSTLERTFSHGGRFEDRMRRVGMHLWYDVKFDESLPLTKADDELRSVDGVEIVENIPICTQNNELYFNDPNLRKQWGLINNGNILSKLTEGCDINILTAWERGVVGNEKVIVAVVDGGVDASHEDLKDNIWHGTDPEGKPITGINSVNQTYRITPDDHGSHVAGIIAAVNNNGIGLSGIAGGDMAAGIKGARIMSCQIFSGDKGGDQANAIVWAANNGAVIANNSWGYNSDQNMTDTPKSMKVAIDYFNQFAGCDENGNQLPDSPMKGGVVIFASGNEGAQMSYPASYDGCIAVSAIAGDYELAYYSNYGDWIDISAPGGDAKKNQYILSSITSNEYDGYQGTSMACPHVSGVAALIVSEFGGEGFTREDLIDRLLTTATDIGLPSRMVGAGMVNASAAVARYGEDLPFTPQFAKSEEVSGTSFKLKYIMPEANNGVECKNVEVFYSRDSFKEPTEHTEKISQYTGKAQPGDTLVVSVENLAYDTEYYFSVRGVDVYGNVSDISENEVIRTKENQAPVIEALDGTEFTFQKYMKATLKFKVTDPENKLKDVKYESASDIDKMSIRDGLYVIDIDAAQIPGGTYKSRIIATDELDKVSVCEIIFTVEENHAPVLAAELENVLFNSTSLIKITFLSEYIMDEDEETLQYKITSSNESVVKIHLHYDILTLEANNYGETTITITASDSLNESVKTTFKVVVRDGKTLCDLYPNPVKDGKLFIRGSDTEEVNVKIAGGYGAIAYEGTVNPDPFNPAVVDISGFMSGVYNVTVTDKSGNKLTQNIVKL